ncbi:DinB family protein [Microlunatus elymi]|uniref:DinB family protein n=1 Tax=Microlunatus elymi TaxID=2596828 RepID=A0A516PV87_9ACTN|nr:DinB family protein [Microlunatus elymi]QDP95073.1 DinB family protein [Microlunatus elymi]
MTRYIDEDLHDAEFRECDLTGARLIGVVMQDAVIDGLVTNLVVNGVEVTAYVEAELDRRHPVRVLIRSQDAADLREAAGRLHAAWDATIDRIRGRPGMERRSVNDERSALQTLRHLVFVHDSWFRRCCLGSTELFTPFGIGPDVEPYRAANGLDPSLDEVVRVRQAQAVELEAWLDKITAEQLAARAPVPDDDVWPPYARGRSVWQCLGTVLTETFEHHRFCVRDLDLIESQDAHTGMIKFGTKSQVQILRAGDESQ